MFRPGGLREIEEAGELVTDSLPVVGLQDANMLSGALRWVSPVFAGMSEPEPRLSAPEFAIGRTVCWGARSSHFLARNGLVRGLA
jgi:hypothetical protein